MRYLLAFFVLLIPLHAATTYVSNGEESGVGSVQAIHDDAGTVNGDTITIPAGTFNWSSAVTITKAINLIGAGTTAVGGGGVTTIVDDYASGSPMLTFYGTRISGITFTIGTGTAKPNQGLISFIGERLDHCTFVNLGSRYMSIYSNGVLDSCVFTMSGNQAAFFFANSGDGGDGSTNWSEPTSFGSSDYFYVENNIFTNESTGTPWNVTLTDGGSGAKFVVRFNTVHNANLSDAHSTGHSGDDRGVRSREIYGNLVTRDVGSYGFSAINLISGTCLVWGNSWNDAYERLYSLAVPRRNADTYTQAATPAGWGYAGTAYNGTGSDWDGNDNTTTGYPVIDQPGRGQGDLLTGSFPNKVNSTTGTIAWPNQALEPMYIWAITGTFSSGGTEVSDGSGGRVVANRDYYLPTGGIQTNATTPFNGTTGTGWGTLANRPTTCTTGVAYWATDQGSWNQSASNPYGVQQNGADGVLYVATATNTWSLYYTPYTYPHPLRGAGVATYIPGRLRMLRR